MPATPVTSVDEDLRRRFEAAWKSGRPEPVHRFLPPEGHPQFMATLEELILIELEMAWKGFDQATNTSAVPFLPLVEQYLMRFPCLNQPEVALRLLRQEFLVRHRYGDRPSGNEYQARFPQFVATGKEVETLIASSANAPPPVPVIPGYEILEELGHGGMGVVYKAQQRSLKRLVALKMILGARATEQDLTRFRIEAEAVAQLQHPNIAQIYEVGEHENRPYCALEFVDGGNLAQKAAGTPQPAVAAAGLVEQLARAAQSAHEHGIVHRDLKPANVLLTSAGLPKITDFGLAKRLQGDSSQTQAGTILGTPSYMAPEQADPGRGPIGPAADVYGLGAVLYELLTARPPFRAETVFDTMQQVLTDEPVPPTRLRSKVPRDLETICLTCLRKEPRRRYPSAAALADDLGRFLRGEPIVARPVGWAEQAFKWAKRRPAAAALLVSVVLLVAGGVTGLFVWQQMEQNRLQKEYEYEQSRREEEQRRAEYLAVLLSGVAADESFALKEVRASRFVEAQRILHRAVDTLPVEPLLDAKRAELETKRDRAQRLADFYRLTDQCQWLGFLDADSEALAACQTCLKLVGVPDRGKDWPTQLPTAELDGAQRQQLQKDVNAAIMLWISLRVKRGLVLTLKGGAREEDKARAKVDFQHALDLLPLVEDAARWHMCRLAEFVCRHHLKMEKTPEAPKDEPLNGYDYFGMGIIHVWIASRTGAASQPGAKLDPITQAIIKSVLGGSGGLDLATPSTTAESMLQKAADLEPNHYWSHFWLGWGYLALKPPQPHAAEMAFSKCIEIRPAYGFGYAERGRARFLMRDDMPNDLLRKELERRGLEDIRQALSLNPHDPYIHWVNAQMLAALGQRSQVLAECAQAIELEAPLRALDGRILERNSSVAEQIKTSLAFWIKENPNDAEVEAVLAHSSWALDQEDAALDMALKVLEKDAQQPRALAVRGAVFLRRGQIKEALSDFEAALSLVPKFYLACAGRARAQELLGKQAEALESYTFVLNEVAKPDWQRLEAYLGQARTLAALGRDAESREALAKAEEISPGISEGVLKR